MAFPNEVFGLVKYAVSATTIREWAQSGALFKRLVSDYEASKNRLDDSLLSAILWHQERKMPDLKRTRFNIKLILPLLSII